MSTKSITLLPDWKRWFWGYFFGVVLIPLFGIGLFVLWNIHSKRKAISYEVTDRQIKATGKEYSQTVDLANITQIDVEQNWLEQKMGIGDLRITTESREIQILGQNDPKELSEMIGHAVKAERKRIEELNKVETKAEEAPNPGTMDRMDYLTGLWQQGLITNEEFEKEKKHFGE